jgi:translin
MALNGIIERIKKELDQKDRRREEIFAKGREIRRLSTKAIMDIHRFKYAEAADLIKQAKDHVVDLSETDLRFSFLQEALQEYAEAVIVLALVKKEELPGPDEVGIPTEAYALGLADAIGELRRHILDLIRSDRFDEVEHFLDLMDEMSYGIKMLDYPSAILPIRRKQDVARMLQERTRGEVTMAQKLSRVEK